MDKVQKIIIYLTSFTILLFIFRIFGIINIEGGEIVGYAFIFYGISSVYLSFGQNEKWTLLLGTVFFCLGVLLFMINNFHFPNVARLIVPSILMTFSISLLMLYLDDLKNKVFLYSSVSLFIITILIAKIWGVISFVSFFTSIWTTITGYWPVVLILLLVVFLLRDKDF